MSTDDPRRETLAEALSWACFDWTRYSETAHEDHNRWSWRGDGHGAPDEAARTTARGWVYEAADELLAAFPHLTLDGRTVRAQALREVADAWQWGGWTALLGPDVGPMTKPQKVTDWLRDRADQEVGE